MKDNSLRQARTELFELYHKHAQGRIWEPIKHLARTFLQKWLTTNSHNNFTKKTLTKS